MFSRKNLFGMQGTVTDINGATGTDQCIMARQLTEYSCNANGIITSEFYNCANFGTCSNRACNNEPSGPAPPCIPKTCSQLGKQCGSYNNGCGGTVSCGSCPSGQECNSAGQCVVQQKCTDTDGGIVPNVKGTVTTLNGESKTDSCLAFRNFGLTEYYCKGDSISSTFKFCRCRDGACLQ